MKKYFLAFTAVAVLFTACSKENPINENSNIPESSSVKVYTLTATMPETKATVNEETGKFEWESTDQIAVYDNEQHKYQIFSTSGSVTTTDSGSTVTFSFTSSDELDHDFTNSVAYYPASRLDAGQIMTPIQLTSASDVPMTATNSNGTLAFVYEAAVVKLTVNNVPSFTESVEFVNGTESYAVEVNHTTNENMVFYLAVKASTETSCAINLYDTAGNEFVNKPFTLTGGEIVNGALIPLKTTIGYPILVENGTSWGGLDIYCYSATDSWKNAEWGSSLATVNEIIIGSKTYSYIIAKGASDSYSFVFRKPNADYPRVEHKGVAVTGETFISLNTTSGARVEGDTTPRLIVYNQDKIGPVYIHYWGEGITATTFDNWDSRKMITYESSNMGFATLCTGLIYTGDNLSSGSWFFYYDISAVSAGSTFNFILHQGDYWRENKNDYGTEFNNVTAELDMYYGWWNHDVGNNTWKAGAWAI